MLPNSTWRLRKEICEEFSVLFELSSCLHLRKKVWNAWFPDRLWVSSFFQLTTKANQRESQTPRVGRFVRSFLFSWAFQNSDSSSGEIGLKNWGALHWSDIRGFGPRFPSILPWIVLVSPFWKAISHYRLCVPPGL